MWMLKSSGAAFATWRQASHWHRCSPPSQAGERGPGGGPSKIARQRAANRAFAGDCIERQYNCPKRIGERAEASGIDFTEAVPPERARPVSEELRAQVQGGRRSDIAGQKRSAVARSKRSLRALATPSRLCAGCGRQSWRWCVRGGSSPRQSCATSRIAPARLTRSAFRAPRNSHACYRSRAV